MSTYNKSMPKAMRHFSIVTVQSNTLAIGENGIQSMVKIDLARLALDDYPLENAFQRLPVKKKPLSENGFSGFNTQTKPI